MIRSRASVPMAENMSANFAIWAVDFWDCAVTIFLYLQKYGLFVNVMMFKGLGFYFAEQCISRPAAQRR